MPLPLLFINCRIIVLKPTGRVVLPPYPVYFQPGYEANTNLIGRRQIVDVPTHVIVYRSIIDTCFSKSSFWQGYFEAIIAEMTSAKPRKRLRWHLIAP